MKIAMIGSKGMPAIHGGVERHVHDLAVRLVERDHDVRVYSRAWYAPEQQDVVEGVRAIFTPSIHTKHFDAISHTLTATLHAMRTGVDVIHYHGVGPSLLSWIPRVLTPRIRVINTFHSIDRKHEKWGLVARLALWIGEWAASTFAHKTIAVSRTIQQYTRDVFSRESEYIPNGVPLYTKKTASDQLAQFGLQKDEYILFVSRLIPHKGAHYLVAAYQQLLQDNPALLGNKKLVIVGGGHHTDEYENYLHNMTEGDPRIVFTGFQSGETLAQLFSHAHIMVHPSTNEGLPITVLEAMSYGIPLLVSDIIEHRELIHDAGFLFRSTDTVDLKKKLAILLARDEATIEKQGKENIARIKQEFTWDAIVPQIEETYLWPEPAVAPQMRKVVG